MSSAIRLQRLAGRSTLDRTRGRGRAAAATALLTVTVVPACGPGAPTDAGLEAFEVQLDRRVPELLETHRIPGAAVAVVEDGEPASVLVYGDARREVDPVEPTTLFRAESITKAVTAWGVMWLVEEGLVGLDDPVEDHLRRWELPATEYPSREVTVRRLLSHSAGLPAGVFDDYGRDEQPPSLEETLSGAAGVPPAGPVKEPGAAFTYSNVGYGVLELLIEDVTGRDYAAFMQEELLEPLGMPGATFRKEAGPTRTVATGYDADGDPVPDRVEPVRAHGAMRATAGELATFLAAGMTDPRGGPPGREVLSAESVTDLHTPQVETQGFHALGSDAAALGHFVEELPNGRQGVFHGGEGAGFLTMAYGVPAAGAGIVILTNSKRGWPFLAEVLGDWAEWRGVGPVAMARIFARAETLLWVLAGLAVAGSLWMVWRVLWGLRKGRRRLDPASSRGRLPRTLQAGAALLLVGLWWLALREPVAWLLPPMIPYLDGAVGALGALLALSSLLPRVQVEEGKPASSS